MPSRPAARPLPDWRARLEEATGTPLMRLVVVFGLILGGLIVMLVSSAREPRPEPSATAAAEEAVHTITVRGRIAGLESAPPGTRVSFHLPQVPADVDKSVEELAAGPDGSFEVKLEVSGAAAPTTCGLSVSQPGKPETRLDNVDIQGEVAEVPAVDLGATTSDAREHEQDRERDAEAAKRHEEAVQKQKDRHKAVEEWRNERRNQRESRR